MTEEKKPAQKRRKAVYHKKNGPQSAQTKRNAVARRERQLLALELIAQGYTYAEAAKKVGVGIVAIWDYVKDALNIYKERIAESVESLVAFEWQRLETQEQRIWSLIRSAEKDAVDEEGKRDYRALTGLLGRLQALNSDRRALIDKIDPGADHSLDTTVSLVVVRNRQQLPKIIEATEFAQRVIHDEFSSESEEEQPEGD